MALLCILARVGAPASEKDPWELHPDGWGVAASRRRLERSFSGKKALMRLVVDVVMVDMALCVGSSSLFDG